MGGHYGSIHVRAEDSDAVQLAVHEVAREQKLRFLVAPPIKGWTTIFPENNGQNPKISEILASQLSKYELIHCLVHDDDVFAYFYFQNGELKDRFNSCPDYFDEKNHEPRGGNAKVLAHFLSKPEKTSELQSLLDAPRFDFEKERLDRFAKMLGLPNAVSAYEYLQGGEREGIKHWRKFIHIPNLSDEKSADRARDLAEKAEVKRLVRDRVLLVDLDRKGVTKKSFSPLPVWCIDPNSSEVLFAWNPMDLATHHVSTPLIRLGRNGDERAEGCEISSNCSDLAVDTTGNWLAVGNDGGDWSFQIWNLREKQLRLTVPQPGAVRSLCFNRNGEMLLVCSEKLLTVLSLATFEAVEVLLPSHGEKVVIHPDGKLATVVDNFGILLIVDLVAKQVINQVWIKEKPDGLSELKERLFAKAIASFDANVQGQLSQEKMEEHRLNNRRHFLLKESIRTVAFSSDGASIFCGTNAALHRIAWEDVLRCPVMTPVSSKLSVEIEADEKGNKLVYTIVLDEARDRVLFSGCEGKICFYELSTGRFDALLVAPMQTRFINFAITPDRAHLVVTAWRHAYGSNKQWPMHLQVWNYAELCKRAQIPH